MATVAVSRSKLPANTLMAASPALSSTLRSRQLHSQREPVEVTADRGNDFLIAFQSESVTGAAGAIDEQLDTVVLRVQRLESAHVLVTEAERLSTGRHNRQFRAAIQEIIDPIRDRSGEMFAVVEDQHGPTARQFAHNLLPRVIRRSQGDAHRVGDRTRDQQRLANSRQIDDPDPVGPTAREGEAHSVTSRVLPR